MPFCGAAIARHAARHRHKTIAITDDEEFADEVCEQLLKVDGVLVWVDPLSRGKTRALLDPMLRDVTPKEFVDGLALGQLAPGPPLMLAAFIGFKLFGIAGAAVAGAAIFLPSFLMILSILPLLNKMKNLQWLRAFMRGVGPAVIGALAVSLVQIAPQAAPDVFTWILMALTVGVILLRNVGPLPLVASGAVIGLLAKNEFVERLAEWAW